MSKSKNPASKSTAGAAGEKPNPFGVSLKPIGKNLTLDRGANSVITTSKEDPDSEKSKSQVERLKNVFGKDEVPSEKKISPRLDKGISRPLSSTSSSSSSAKTSVRGKSSQGAGQSKINEIKIGVFTLSKESSVSKEKTKSNAKNANVSSASEELSSFSRTSFHQSRASQKNPTSSYDPITGEIKLDKAKVEKFASELKAEKKTNDPPWKVKLKSVNQATGSKKEETVVIGKSADCKASRLSVSEKDNSRRSSAIQPAQTAPFRRETKITNLTKASDTSKSVKKEKPEVNGIPKKSTDTKTTDQRKPEVKEDKPVRAKQKSVKNDKAVKEENQAKVSPRGDFVQRLIKQCETRDERQDSKVSKSDENLEFPETLLEKLAVLEGLVNDISSDESGDSEGGDGYDDVATVIECLAEEEKKKRRFAFRDIKLKRTQKLDKDARRQSAPPLESQSLKPKEEENIYNSPEETELPIPDWDTGSSRVSVAGSESTSSDSVTNPISMRPHTVIELSDKQARKLKKRQADNSESSTKWKKKWKEFYRRSQDLLDIPGLQMKLENLSLSQLPANVKQKLRERIKKKKIKKTGRLEINPVEEDDDFTDEFAASSSEDLRYDSNEGIYQTIGGVQDDAIPIVNVNLRVSASPEKIPISPAVSKDSVDSAPNLPPRTHTGSVYEKYSELGPKVSHDSPPDLPPTLPPKLSDLTPPTKPKLNTKRASLPGLQLVSGDLEVAPPLPPRNGRMSLGSLGNLDVRVPPQSSTSSLAESYLKQPKLADKFPSESPSKSDSVKRDSLLLGRVPPPLHIPILPDSVLEMEAVGAGGLTLGQGYLDMEQGEGRVESSPSRASGSSSVRAPFENMMDFKRRNKERRPDSAQVDIDFELDVSVCRSRYKSRFEREPLYQYYNKDYIKRQSWQRALSEEPSSPAAGKSSEKHSHDYINPEVTITISVENQQSSLPSVTEGETQNAPGAYLLSTVSPSGTVHRSLWSQVPEVVSSGVAENLTQEQKKEQEAMFEIITSEASYFKSLNVLINTFVMSPELCGEISEKAVLTKQQKHLLFSNIGAVRDASEKFLADLEARWNENVLISDISDIIIKHANENFDCYVKYCSNKTYQDRTYSDLLKNNPSFKEALIRLQGLPEVQGLPMASFFLLPMQRITRLPLLMDGVCRHRDQSHENHKEALQAQDALNKLVKKCNEGAKRMEQTEQLCMIEKQLDFKIKKVPIVSASRHLVKEGELTRIVTDSSSKRPFGKNRPSKQSLYLFLLNDLLLVTKRKGDNLFSVIDCTKRNSVHCEVIQSPENFPLLPNGAPSGCKNLFLMVMLENHEGKQVELILSCNSPSDRTRWMEAVTPKAHVSENERIYEEWDCPQVQAVHRYIATQPDELDLEEADVVNVFRKMADGWYEGERIRDGVRGWFPKSYVEEILSSHVRARNLRLRYRLLVASKDFSVTGKIS
ncbi:rho guanine nucleotide exchange factor 26-like isoform X2 [Liolophura sinensis]|uniref:rho guanine nucleotide exchange factor 26-like isoform X2 n=1 Tax=Liolophura sinensis TaxID=3198878 RepID=UPI00315890D1